MLLFGRSPYGRAAAATVVLWLTLFPKFDKVRVTKMLEDRLGQQLSVDAQWVLDEYRYNEQIKDRDIMPH